VQDNKLYISGVAPSTQAKNKVWDQIKQVDPMFSDLTADIRVEEGTARRRPEPPPAEGSRILKFTLFSPAIPYQRSARSSMERLLTT